MSIDNYKPRVAVTNDGDVLIQGSGIPVLFIPRTHVPDLLAASEKTVAVIITDVGAAAIETVLAANATVKATTIMNATGAIESVTLKFLLPNGLVVAYTTDDNLASDRERIKALGIDLIVTDTTVDWSRHHAPFLGSVIAKIPTVPPQIAGFHQLGQQYLSEFVRDALAQRDRKRGINQ